MLFVLALFVAVATLRILGFHTPATLFTISLITGCAAFVAGIVILVSYFTVPPEKLTESARINYCLFLAVLCITAIQTGIASIPYGILLYASFLFAGVFGGAGIAASGAVLAVLCVQQFFGQHAPLQQLVAPLTAGIVPLAISAFLWVRQASRAEKETEGDRSYHELAHQLSQESGKADGVINAIRDGVLSLDKTGVIELINPAAQELLGWGSNDSLKLSYKSVFKMRNTKNQEVDEPNDPVAKALTDNQPVINDSFSLETQSGKTFMASISVSPIGAPGNGVIVVFRDITTERADERQRAEFISTASHEMRTPVASIEGYLGLALNPSIATIDEKARDYINKAHASAQHLGRLFADLLDVSKADDSRLKNTPKTVDVVPFIHDIVQGFETSAKDKSLRLIYKPIPNESDDFHDPIRKLNPMYYAYVDNDHLREIVQNLVENAVKYTLKGGVTVDVTGDTKHITISVTDTGIGIPREDQSHLFQKFYRIDNSDTREIGGTGLGLYLCRRLAEAIGGRLWLESEYKQGSTFFLEIPRIDAAEAEQHIEREKKEAEAEKAEESSEAAKEAKETKEKAMLASARELAERMKNQETAPVATPETTSAIPAPDTPPPAAQPPQPVSEPEIPDAGQLVDQIFGTPLTITPVQPAPTPQPAPSSAYAPNPLPPLPQSNRPNTPLSAIEANPAEYTAARRPDGSIVIPTRKP